jgi:hypothetical protein
VQDVTAFFEHSEDAPPVPGALVPHSQHGEFSEFTIGRHPGERSLTGEAALPDASAVPHIDFLVATGFTER